MNKNQIKHEAEKLIAEYKNLTPQEIQEDVVLGCVPENIVNDVLEATPGEEIPYRLEITDRESIYNITYAKISIISSHSLA